MPAIRILALLKKHKEGLDPRPDHVRARRSSAGTGPRSSKRSARLASQGRRPPRSAAAFRLAEKTGVVRGRFVTARPRIRLRHAGGRRRGHLRPGPLRPRGPAGGRGRRRRQRAGQVRQARGPDRAHPQEGPDGLLGVYVERGGAPYLQPFDSPSAGRHPAQVPGQAPARAGHDRRSRPDDARPDRGSSAGPEDPGVDAQVVIRALRPAVRVPGGRPGAKPTAIPDLESRPRPSPAAGISATGRP